MPAHTVSRVSSQNAVYNGVYKRDIYKAGPLEAVFVFGPYAESLKKIVNCD